MTSSDFPLYQKVPLVLRLLTLLADLLHLLVSQLGYIVLSDQVVVVSLVRLMRSLARLRKLVLGEVVGRIVVAVRSIPLA